MERLRALPGRVALVGIHLCRRLSARCVEIFNVLGPKKVFSLALTSLRAAALTVTEP